MNAFSSIKHFDTLPAGKIAEEVNRELRSHGRLVITAPPGSGKSTLLPLTILQDIPEGKIVMLEPRRAAARQIAMRMADEIGERIGATVGYRMRFESKVSETTRLEVVTEGILERLLIADPTLEGISAVIFDEFHERSLTSDLTLALTLQAQNLIRDDLKIIIMSATMNSEEICNRLGAALVTAEGRMFDVEVRYGGDTDPRECVQTAVSAVRRAWREQEGNILVFLPGYSDIARCVESLKQILPEAEIFPLHGMLTPVEQYKAIEYNPANRRKIVVATPIAETSLTIEGIRTVVDSGLYRTVRYDPSTGLSRLETERITLDMAQQRTGRAGRLSSGVCYRLWSKAMEHRMAEHRVPEILSADLSGMILDIAAWGESNPLSLPWLTPPPQRAVAEAVRLLSMLGAVDESGSITGHGKRMAGLPCHPRISNMLVKAPGDSARALACDLAAILEEKDPMNDDRDADINTRIALLRQYRRGTLMGAWKRIERAAAQYRHLARCGADNTPPDPVITGNLIALAFPERIAMRLKDGVYRLPSGENIRLNEEDDLSACEFLAVAAMDRRIFLASPVSKDTLHAHANLHDNISWNSREGKLVAMRESRIGVLVLESRKIEDPDPDALTEVLCEAAKKHGLSMFDFNDATAALQQRLQTVSGWHPELNIPDMSTDTLLENARQWLPMYAEGATTVASLHKIDMCQVIKGMVGYELMNRVDAIAPEHLRLPGGRNVRIQYRQGTPDPVVSARLQDCLGMLDTPRVDNGTRPVLMELLSPGFKPVQLTRDLRGFWTGTYYDVRKELKRRYPKHRWPDDPLAPNS
ncbi:MAG: ATP-dependent helicase HrpB [Bacteroidales bacterium]|nr:ATP-dependent helicase HrpB [Bacteroidales bacterium]